jgi:hypothetical protein
METSISQRLNGLLRRFRLFHGLWLMATIWLVFAFGGYLLLRSAKQSAGISSFALSSWIAGGALASLVGWWFSRRWMPDQRALAMKIEQSFPNLEGRLSTAIEIRPRSGSNEFGFLQRTVIAEALHHDVRYQWHSLVSRRRLIMAWLASLPALISVCVVGVALWRLPRHTATPLLSRASSSQVLPPEVIPGNTEIAKGDSLIVTASFRGKLPQQVWLVRQPVADVGGVLGTVERLVMKQSLGDPIFAGYLNDIRQPLDYRIEFDDLLTETFTIRVFEYPEVVRTDARLSYPLYANLDAKEIADTRRVAAPIGSTLTWLVHLNKPIEQGWLEQNHPANPQDQGQPTKDILPLVLDSNNPLLASCSLEVTQSAQWTIHLQDSDGRENKVAHSLRVSALANKEPVLQLTQGGDATVSALEEFEVAAKVKDDYQLKAVGIAYQLAGGELVEKELSLVSSQSRAKESTLAATIDFEVLQAQPEQLLSYYLWAEDLDPQGEVRRVTSDMYFAEVRSFEEIYRQGDRNADEQRQQQQQQNQNGQSGQPDEELLELQKQIISASWNIARKTSSKDLPARAVDDVNTVAASQDQAISMLQEMAAEAPESVAATVEAAQSAMKAASLLLEQAAQSLSKATLLRAIGLEQQAYQALLKLQSRENEVSRQQQSQQARSQRSRRQQNRQQQVDQLELDERENRYQDERRAQEQQETQSETRQVASRLRELAMRQQDLNQQLRDVEAALQAAKTEEEKQELEQRLERLRQQQQQILEDADELQQRLQESQTAELQQTQESLQQTRENLQQANQSLRENNTGQAISAGTRAQEQLEEMREDVRQQAANQFGESMQQMRSQADQLQQRQKQLLDQLQQQPDQTQSTGLRADSDTTQKAEMQQSVEQQKEQLDELLDSMQQTIQQAEESEPLLAQKLFDGYRRAQQEKVEEQLELTQRLLNRDLDQQARRQATETMEDLQTLGNDIGQAAQSVLGSDLNAMRLALEQLDAARRQVDNEIARETGRDPAELEQQQPGPQQPGQQQPGQQQPGPQQPGQQQPGQQQPGQQQPGQQQPGQQQPGQQQPGQQQPGQQQPNQPGLRSDAEQLDEESLGEDGLRPNLLGGAGGSDRNWRDAAPITGEDFRQWSDRLRDVEELVTDPELRWQATRIRQAARTLRADLQRNGQAPRWNDVEDLVAKPLRELQRRVSQELIRRAAEQTDIVPVDRDPVPSQFRESVREYYERLGKGK